VNKLYSIIVFNFHIPDSQNFGNFLFVNKHSDAGILISHPGEHSSLSTSPANTI